MKKQDEQRGTKAVVLLGQKQPSTVSSWLGSRLFFCVE